MSISLSGMHRFPPASRSAPSHTAHAAPPKPVPSKLLFPMPSLSPLLHTPRQALLLTTSPFGSNPPPRKPKSAPSTMMLRGCKPRPLRSLAPTYMATVPTEVRCSTLCQATTQLCPAPTTGTGVSLCTPQRAQMTIMTRPVAFCMK